MQNFDVQTIAKEIVSRVLQETVSVPDARKGLVRELSVTGKKRQILDQFEDALVSAIGQELGAVEEDADIFCQL